MTPLAGRAWHGGQISVNVLTCKFVPALPWLLPLVNPGGGLSPGHARSHASHDGYAQLPLEFAP